MEKNQLKHLDLNGLQSSGISTDEVRSFVEEVLWLLDACEEQLLKKDVTEFYTCILKIQDFSAALFANSLERLCTLTLKAKGQGLPNSKLFVDALYKEYFMMRKKVFEFLNQTPDEERNAA